MDEDATPAQVNFAARVAKIVMSSTPLATENVSGEIFDSLTDGDREIAKRLFCAAFGISGIQFPPGTKIETNRSGPSFEVKSGHPRVMILAAEILEGLGYISEESRDAIIDVLRKGL